MCGVLALLFIVIPAVEIYLIIEVGSLLGPLATLAVIIATGVAGAALARHQGLWAMRKLQDALAQGYRVGTSLVEAALVLTAAVLLLTPGFLTDGVGFALLVPPIRHQIAQIVTRRYAARATTRVIVEPWGMSSWPDQADQADQKTRPPGPAHQGRDRHDDDHEPPPPGVIDV